MVPLVHLAFAAGEEWKKLTDQAVWRSKYVERQFITHISLSSDCSTKLDAYRDCKNPVASVGRRGEILDKNEQFPWPGSLATQNLGIFSLMHMLSIKDNQQLALTENLVQYLVCLSWHLSGEEKNKLRKSLANFKSVSAPSLKIAAKSVLAVVNGLDMVFSL